MAANYQVQGPKYKAWLSSIDSSSHTDAKRLVSDSEAYAEWLGGLSDLVEPEIILTHIENYSDISFIWALNQIREFYENYRNMSRYFEEVINKSSLNSMYLHNRLSQPGSTGHASYGFGIRPNYIYTASGYFDDVGNRVLYASVGIKPPSVKNLSVHINYHFGSDENTYDLKVILSPFGSIANYNPDCKTYGLSETHFAELALRYTQVDNFDPNFMQNLRAFGFIE